MNKTTEALKLAEQEKQEPVVWISVADQMPKSFKPVLVRYWYERTYSGGIVDRVIRALWIPAKTEESNDEDHFEYDEDTDTYYIPEGWYEVVDNWDEYSSVHVCEGDITHWMPLPEFPNAAPVDAKAIRAEALEEAAKVCEEGADIKSLGHAIAAAIRGLKEES